MRRYFIDEFHILTQWRHREEIMYLPTVVHHIVNYKDNSPSDPREAYECSLQFKKLICIKKNQLSRPISKRGTSELATQLGKFSVSSNSLSSNLKPEHSAFSMVSTKSGDGGSA